MTRKQWGLWAIMGLTLAQLSCSSPAVPKGIVPKAKDEKISTDVGLETVDPKVDILFIIDNSASMYSHQNNLSKNVASFVANFFTKVQVDFHIGVITTDNGNWGGTGDCCGKLVGYPAFVDKSTPDFQTLIARRMIVGTQGSSEEMIFDPLVSALSEPNISGANKDFLRSNAHLAVVVITDAEDQSHSWGSKDAYDFLVKLKGKADKVLLYGVIVPSSEVNCPRDDNSFPRQIEDFLSMSVTTGGNSFSLCDSQFGDKLSAMGKDLAKRVGNIFYLARIPIVESIEVTFGSQVIPAHPTKGWSFDPDRNALVFGSEIEWEEQPKGTKVKVKYDFTQFPDKPKS